MIQDPPSFLEHQLDEKKKNGRIFILDDASVTEQR